MFKSNHLHGVKTNNRLLTGKIESVIKIPLLLSTYFLSAGAAEAFLPELGEKLTLIAALAFFLYYFMKELKQVRESQDKMRVEYETKFENMFERVAEMERKSTEALQKVSYTNERLADAVDALKDQLTQTNKP